MLKQIKKIGFWLIAVLFTAIVVMVIFSPFTKKGANDYRSVEYTVEINAPAETVFNYLGNSDNAANWSSYVDHISTLNSDFYKDGELGSIRRCFKNKNEEGILWDEEILAVTPNKNRVLSIYNMQGFASPISGLQTEQIYEAISANKTQLTFSLYFASHGASWFETLKMHLASYTIYKRFKDNLENVKQLVEHNL